MQTLLFILGLVMFVGLVVIHEWGHYYVAKRNGVKSDEFGIGIPPRAWSRKLKSGMTFSLNWLPLGGFVKLKGENDSDKRKGSFGAASLGAKTKIILAGVFMNLIVGVFLLMILAWVGMPKLLTQDKVGQDQFTIAGDTKVVHQDVLASQIIAGSPADSIGLQGRDALVVIASGGDNRAINSVDDLKHATSAFAGQTVSLTYKHGSQTITKDVKLLSKKEVEDSQKKCQKDNDVTECKGYLGVVDPTLLQIRRSTWSAPIVAVGLTGQVFELTFKGLGHAFAGLGSIIAGTATGNHDARVNGQTQASSQVGGPVAIGAVLWGGGTLGVYFVLMIIAIVSLTLALMNILPIPALDGGRLFLILFSRGLLRRPLSQSVEERIVATSMALILALFVLITIVDVRRFL